jgi:hypothetical protein
MSGQFGFGATGGSPPRTSPRPDLIVHGEGTIYLIHAVTDAGHGWIEAHLSSDAPRLGTAVAVEHRYIRDIVLGASRDGLVVR